MKESRLSNSPYFNTIQELYVYEKKDIEEYKAKDDICEDEAKTKVYMTQEWVKSVENA